MRNMTSRPKGPAIKARRLKLGLSKEAMARASGVSVITYKKVEDDKSVRDTSLAMILDAFEREEERRTGDASVSATAATAAAGYVDKFPRPDWMGMSQYDALMSDVSDYYRYLVQRAASARKSPEEHALDDLFGDQAG